MYKTSRSLWFCHRYHLYQITLFVSKKLLPFLYYLCKIPGFLLFTEFFTFYSVMVVSNLILNPGTWKILFIHDSINLNFSETFKSLNSIKNTLQMDKLLQRSIAYQMRDCHFPVAADSELFEKGLLMNMMIRFVNCYSNHGLDSSVSTIDTMH